MDAPNDWIYRWMNLEAPLLAYLAVYVAGIFVSQVIAAVIIANGWSSDDPAETRGLLGSAWAIFGVGVTPFLPALLSLIAFVVLVALCTKVSARIARMIVKPQPPVSPELAAAMREVDEMLGVDDVRPVGPANRRVREGVQPKYPPKPPPPPAPPKKR